MLPTEFETITLISLEKVKALDIQITLTSDKEDGIEIKLENDKWSADKTLDPLSCILLTNQLSPKYDGDDNIAVATLAKHFNKSTGWIRSCSDGIRGKSNSSTSITGWVCGSNIRKQLNENNSK